MTKAEWFREKHPDEDKKNEKELQECQHCCFYYESKF